MNYKCDRAFCTQMSSQFTPICDAEQQESWDKEIINVA